MNGLIQLATQIYGYLSLLELGFGAAVMYKMYKPFATKDYDKVSELFNGSRKIFVPIGVIIFVIGTALGILMPLFVHDLSIPNYYVFSIFFLYAVDYLTLYMFGLPYRNMLMSDQKSHVISIVINARHLIFRLIELVLIIMKVDIIIITIGSIVANLIASYLLILKVNKLYPWLNKKAKPDTSSLEMTKDVIVHRIAKMVFNSTDQILLAVTSGLVVVSIYGAYNYIVIYLRQILEYIATAPRSGFGNLIHDSSLSKNDKKKIFDEYIILMFFFAIIVTITFTIAIKPFVVLWISNDYKISFISVILFGVIVWFEYILRPLSTIVESSGLYKVTKRNVIEAAIINIVLSLILVKPLGMSGVLLSTCISYFYMHPLNVKVIFREVIGYSSASYYKNYILSTLLMITMYIASLFIVKVLDLYSVSSILNWIISTVVIGGINLVIVFIIFYINSVSFKSVLKRIMASIKNFIKKKK
jgi:O-antigen/teichoic acid export membrane protein